MPIEPPVVKDQIINEWKEGPHKVIEKQSGHGEDVRPFAILLTQGLGLLVGG